MSNAKSDGLNQMHFIFRDHKFTGATAVEIVRAIERRAALYNNKNGSVRDFLVWSLDQMADRIPPRELDVSPDLDDETISFNYLCLLDGCGIGTFDDRSENFPGNGVKQGMISSEA